MIRGAYIVGLERHKKRYTDATERLAQVGVTADLWHGVDGAGGIRYRSGERYSPLHAYGWNGRGMSNSELGCYLSHYRLLQHISANSAEFAENDRFVVFEDDVIPKPDLKDTLDYIARLSPAFHYINLIATSNQERGHIPLGYLPNRYRINWHRKLFYKTTAYVVNLAGIRLLLHALMPIKTPVDDAIATITDYRFHRFSLSPSAVDEYVQEGSTISNRTVSNSRFASFIRFLTIPLHIKHHFGHIPYARYKSDYFIERAKAYYAADQSAASVRSQQYLQLCEDSSDSAAEKEQKQA